MYKLIPLANHCVVEVTDFPLPIINIDDISFVESNNPFDLEDAKRLIYPYYEGKTPTEIEFIDIFQNEFITKVLPAGATPNVLVFRKLDGSIAIFNLLIEFDKPNPIFLGLGNIISSLIVLLPLPN
jgi:hypothetical protein